MKKLSAKHMRIIQTIKSRGFYKPTYSDQEPATQTLLKHTIIVWREDYTGLILTETGKNLKYNAQGNIL